MHGNMNVKLVGLLWTSDRPAPETSTWQHTTIIRDRHQCPRRDSNLPVPASEGLQTHASGCAAMVIGPLFIRRFRKIENSDYQPRHICLSVWNNSAPLDAFSWILNIFRRSREEIQVSLKADRNDWYFTWIPIYMFDHISLSSSYSEKGFRQTFYIKSKQMFYIP